MILPEIPTDAREEPSGQGKRTHSPWKDATWNQRIFQVSDDASWRRLRPLHRVYQ